MKLLDRMLGRPDPARFNPDMASTASVLMTSFGTPSEERILPTYLNSAEAYGNSAVVFGVILARMSLFTEVEFKFQNLANKSLYGSPALAPLEDPWPGATTGELLARMLQDADLAGNAFVRDAGEQLERLRPDWITIVSEIVTDPITLTEVRRVVGYLYDPPAGEGRSREYFGVDEVAHWCPIPDPLASFRGMSWLTPVLREVDADLQMTDYKRAYLTNAATPNMLIKYDKSITPEKLSQFSDRLHARHGGVENGFKTLVLDEGADATVLGNSLKDMAFDVVQAAGENRIAVAGGVPGIVAGLKEGLAAATYSNYEQAMRRFVDLTMRPLWRSACAALAKLIDEPDGSRLWFDTSAIAALRQGEKERADTMQVHAAAASSLITAGYTPESITLALAASDVTLLKHSGRVSVQLVEPGQTPGQTPAAASPSTAPAPPAAAPGGSDG